MLGCSGVPGARVVLLPVVCRDCDENAPDGQVQHPPGCMGLPGLSEAHAGGRREEVMLGEVSMATSYHLCTAALKAHVESCSVFASG